MKALQRVREAYSPATYERLLAIKRQYDPTNLFRVNNNIRPGIPSLPLGVAPPVNVRPV